MRQRLLTIIISIALIAFALLFARTAFAARTDDVWQERLGTYIETQWAVGRNILINGINKYLNFGTLSGSTGYGFRDNGGLIEFKNSGGAWTGIGSGSGGGGSIGTSTTPVIGQIPYWTAWNTLGTVATGTITCTGSASCGSDSFVIGGNLTITGSGLTSYDAWTHGAAGKSATTSAIGIGSSTPWGMLSVTQTGADPAFVVEDSASPDTTPFVVTATGNVGIGTTAPSGKLTVHQGSTAVGLRLERLTSDGDVFMQLTDTVSQVSTIKQLASGGDLQLAPYRNLIISTGNVGIGTTTPNFKLVSTNSTGPQLSLSAGAGNNQWVFRNEGGQLAIATSTYTATSSVSALRINTNGQLQVPNLASCNTIDTDASGVLTCGSDETAGAPAWGSITGTLSAQTDLQNALNGKIEVGTTSVNSITTLSNLSITKSQVSDFGSYIEMGTTSVSSITALPNLSITKSQVSDFGTYLSSYDAWTHPSAGQSATTSLIQLLGNASSTGFSANFAEFGGTATTTFTTDGRIGIASTSPVALFGIDNTANIDPIFSIRNNGGRTFMLLDDDERLAINGTATYPSPESMLHLTHNFTNTFEPYLNLADADSFPLVLQNTNSVTASSTGIGFSVTNASGNIGGALVFKRTGSNSMGELNFYTKQSTTAGVAPALVLTLTDAGRAVMTHASSTYASTTRQTINQVIDFANGLCMGQYSGTTTPNVTIQACTSF